MSEIFERGNRAGANDGATMVFKKELRKCVSHSLEHWNMTSPGMKADKAVPAGTLVTV